MESMIPACMQNPTHAQNHYDSAETPLKKGVLWPIFPAGLEIRPHPPKGGPPSQILSRARGRRFMCHPYEVGVASGHSGQAGGDLKCFSTPSGCSGWIVKKTIGQVANPHAILSRRTTTIYKNFRIFRSIQWLQQQP